MAAAIFVDVGESSRMSQTATRGNETDAILLLPAKRRPRVHVGRSTNVHVNTSDVSFYLFVHRFRKSYFSTGSTVTPGLLANRVR